MTTIDYDKMEEYSNKLTGIASAINDELKLLGVDYSKFGSDGEVWSGDSAAETRAQLDNISARFNEFVDLVNAASLNLKTAADNYRTLEQTIIGQ